MYAIIQSGGKQYRVQEGDTIYLEKLEAYPGTALEISEVLAIGSEEGLKVGTPLLADAKVTLRIEEHGRGKKIIVFKYKPKKNYRRKQGHRQPFTKVVVEKIQG